MVLAVHRQRAMARARVFLKAVRFLIRHAVLCTCRAAYRAPPAPAGRGAAQAHYPPNKTKEQGASARRPQTRGAEDCFFESGVYLADGH
jgi:hypothetical protein